ncbi:MAG TPA: hypothetical protein VJZ93_00070 [Candidatus Nanoarchaeia archaeon]|nr:hypothetical protein [Candidatus Nanoarchaeia archaeon]
MCLGCLTDKSSRDYASRMPAANQKTDYSGASGESGRYSASYETKARNASY